MNHLGELIQPKANLEEKRGEETFLVNQLSWACIYLVKDQKESASKYGKRAAEILHNLAATWDEWDKLLMEMPVFLR